MGGGQSECFLILIVFSDFCYSLIVFLLVAVANYDIFSRDVYPSDVSRPGCGQSFGLLEPQWLLKFDR